MQNDKFFLKSLRNVNQLNRLNLRKMSTESLKYFFFLAPSSSMTLCYLASETNISQISETENSLSLHNEF